MVTEIQTLLISINNSIVVPSTIIHILTGILFVMTLLSMRAIKTFPIAKMNVFSVPLYNLACWVMLITVGINRFLDYPPKYPLNSAGYIVAYLMLISYTVWGSYLYKLKYAREAELNGRQTINSA